MHLKEDRLIVNERNTLHKELHADPLKPKAQSSSEISTAVSVVVCMTALIAEIGTFSKMLPLVTIASAAVLIFALEALGRALLIVTLFLVP